MHFTSRQKILFRHCDAAGIVFYPRYFEILNDVVEAFFCDCLKWPFEEMHPDNGGPTVTIKAEFLAPSRHGDHLDIQLKVENIGNSSLTIQTNADCDGEPRFSMEHTMVCVGKDGRATPWPERVRKNLQKYLENYSET